MKFLFLSEDLIAGYIACKLAQEGHEVKLYIDDEERRDNLENMVTKVTHWEPELDWVGKGDGIIVIDNTSMGEICDRLRDEGYYVFGSGTLAVNLENERQGTQNIFNTYGLDSYPTFDFTDIDKAIEHIKNNSKAWVIKKNDVAVNSISYVGKINSGDDVIDVLKNYAIHNSKNAARISLQEKINGVEIAIARYFNGTDWVSPIEINIEHNPFFPGDIGLSTSEMGTIGWYTSNEENELFKRTLAKIKPYLQEINYRGVIDINCIANADGVFPLEFTARFGSPIVHLQSEMLESSWGELIASCAKGTSYSSKWKQGYGIVVFVVTPPFPYLKHLEEFNPKGQRVYLLDQQDTLLKHTHFEDVSYDSVHNSYYISDTRGYTLYVTASHDDFKEAQKTVYERIEKLYFPKMMYRNDIGSKFINTDFEKLKSWKYIE